MSIRTTTCALATGTLLLTLGALSACSAAPDTQRQAATATPTADGKAVRAAKDQAAEEDAAALETAVRASWAAFFKPDPAAYYASFSESCRGGDSSGVALTEEGVKESIERAAQANPTHKQYTVQRFSVDQLNGDTANVTYGLQEPTFDKQGEVWIREDGVWHRDAC
jgi:hypothetical protein